MLFDESKVAGAKSDFSSDKRVFLGAVTTDRQEREDFSVEGKGGSKNIKGQK